ncbi:flagellar basal-body MS-ring/collar protein FliF, partial [Candidatus Aquicultor secundus]
MASPAEAIKNAQTGWQKLEVNQKMIILITVILFVVALGSLIYWVSRPSYSVLFSNLSPEDASSIVTKLQEKKIPYQLSGTQTIQVPSDQVYETRIELAGAGLPQGGTVGFEIFDQSNFGLSEFTQKVNYRRALEGELGRTISQIDEIGGARVHIVIPEPSLYTDKENPATASVIIKPKPGVKISDGQVQGIVNLISKSVEGLKTENITVVDTSGNVLNEAT